MTEFAGRTCFPSSSPQRTPRVRPAYASDMVLGLEPRDILTLLGILCGFAVQYGMFSARLRTQEELLREVRTKLEASDKHTVIDASEDQIDLLLEKTRTMREDVASRVEPGLIEA